jgi:hypothetical protein
MATQVVTQADLANIPNPAEGDTAITEDTKHLWKYTSGAWVDEGVAPLAAPAPGTAIVGTTTIDALFTTMFATRSGDLGAASYVWATPNSINATFPAGTTPSAVNASIMTCKFEARPNAPSAIAP